MSLRRLLSVVRKETRQLFRDKRTFRLFLFAPIWQLLLFGYAISTDLRGVTLGIVLEAPSPEARRMIQEIRNTGAFVLTRESARPDDLRGWLDRGEVQIGLQIPADFSQTISRGETPAVEVLSDGSDSNTATLAFQYLSGAALTWAAGERQDRLRRFPSTMVQFVKVPQINLESRFWYNPDLTSVNYLIPGVLALILLVLTLTQTSLLVVKERELGTLEQLSVTPIQAVELLVGKTIPVALTALGLAGFITLAAWGWFHVPLRGSLVFLFLSAGVYLLNCMGMGLLVSVVSRTQMQAQLTSNFFATPLIMLSGFLFPIDNMPHWAQLLTYALPTRYYMEITRGVFLKGQGFAELWPQAAALAVLGTILYVGGIVSFRKRVD